MGKNAIVGQSGGPTAAINSSLAGVFETAKARGAEKVYGMRYGIKGLLEENVINLSEVLCDSLSVEMLKRTPSSYLGSCRFKLPKHESDMALYEKLFAILKKLDIGYFFYIGGNDSMDTIAKLSDYAAAVGSDIKFMGVPKTIDNDLMCTDHTPGYGSAAKYIGTVIKEITRDTVVYGMQNAVVVEIMGRNAGWLTAAAALAKGADCDGADIICLPEVDFDIDAFMARLKEILAEKPAAIIAVSEGIHLKDGRYVCELATELGSADAFGHRILTGTASFLASEISSRLGIKTRAIELSTLQRCSAHITSAVDIEEAYEVGGAAVKAAFEGNTGMMAGMKRISDHPYHCVTELNDIHTIANMEKKVPLDWITDDGFGIKDDFITYARPLIKGELSPIYADGLPCHMAL